MAMEERGFEPPPDRAAQRRERRAAKRFAETAQQLTIGQARGKEARHKLHKLARAVAKLENADPVRWSTYKQYLDEAMEHATAMADALPDLEISARSTAANLGKRISNVYRRVSRERAAAEKASGVVTEEVIQGTERPAGTTGEEVFEAGRFRQKVKRPTREDKDPMQLDRGLKPKSRRGPPSIKRGWSKQVKRVRRKETKSAWRNTPRSIPNMTSRIASRNG